MFQTTQKSLTKRITFFMTVALISTYALQANAYVDKDDGDYTTLNKRVNVESGVSTTEISSVNGKVNVGDSVVAESISSVNGKVEIGSDLNATEVSTVNGKIEIDVNAQIRRSVEAVNGKIEIGSGSEIGDDVSTVNGSIELEDVKVGEDVRTVNGSIYLKDGTIVEGDIVIGGPNNNNWNLSGMRKPPRLVIDSQSSVVGKIIIYREVDFDFADDSLMDKVDDRSDA